MKYAIILYSKYTGDVVAHLGIAHNSREEANAYIEKDVCTRCNRTEIIMVNEEMVWTDRHRGFQYIKEEK